VRCFHQRTPRTAAGTATITAVNGHPTAANATAPAVATPAWTPFFRDSTSTSARVFDMRRS